MNDLINKDRRSYIIAEIGTNHNNDIQTAKKLIDSCAQIGANAVKFQSWKADQLQNILEENGQPAKVLEILKHYELPDAWHDELMEYCHQKNIDFISTPFSIERAQFLHSINVPAIKISSSDLTYHKLLQEVASYDIPILLSTGMANTNEIELALKQFKKNKNKVILLHCVGAYPPDFADANLLAIPSLHKTFKLPVGISDHYPGHDTVVAAVALGACVIEKHVTLSKKMNTPDSSFALEINEFREMIIAIRNIESALGNGQKKCMPSESGGLIGGRRGIFITKDLNPGDILTENNIAALRPNIGDFQAHDLKDLIGKKISRTIFKGNPLKQEHLSLNETD